jgi:DNA repair protein RadA/Sms
MSRNLDCAISYRSRGWMPIPIPQGSKNPNRRGWQKERWALDDLPRCFNNDQNIGLLLGQPSCGLVDVDLDSPEARSIAESILPGTQMISGRTGSPSSHRWYVCNPLVTTTKFLDPLLADTDERATIVEIRSTGGQTLVPPSIHPTGEIYEWQGELSPALVTGDALQESVRRLAACALVARHWKRGQRHYTSLALAGALLRAGWSRKRVDSFIQLVATAANDEEAKDRVRSVETTERRIIEGQKATGLPSMADLLGEKVIACLQKWLALTISSDERVSEPSHEYDLIRVRCLADVNAEQVDYLWYPYIPKGKLTLIEGDPGVGKSWLTCAITAATAAGAGPTGWRQVNPGNVLMLSVEDGLADTIRPRLDAMQADVTRIFGLEGALVLNNTGLLCLEGKIIELMPVLVVIDPLVAYLGAGIDLHKANETRAVMARLALIAERYQCAILAVRHLTKGGKDRAIYRGIGSIDFTAACRSVLLVGSDPDDPNRRAMVQIKNNLAPMGCSIGYEIRDGKFFWTGTSNLTAGRILALASDEEKNSALHNAEEFLREALSEGPRTSKEVQKEAREAGIAEITLSRAKQSLGVKARKEGRPGEKGQQWVLMLPKTLEDHHQGSQRETDDSLRTNQTDKGFESLHLAEDYHSGAHDSLEMENNNLRSGKRLIYCDTCGSSGIEFTHCDRCGEFLR